MAKVLADQNKLREMILRSLSIVCKSVLPYQREMCLEGLLGITLDDTEIVLVNLKETVLAGAKVNPSAEGKQESPIKPVVIAKKRKYSLKGTADDERQSPRKKSCTDVFTSIEAVLPVESTHDEDYNSSATYDYEENEDTGAAWVESGESDAEQNSPQTKKCSTKKRKGKSPARKSTQNIENTENSPTGSDLRDNMDGPQSVLTKMLEHKYPKFKDTVNKLMNDSSYNLGSLATHNAVAVVREKLVLEKQQEFINRRVYKFKKQIDEKLMIIQVCKTNALEATKMRLHAFKDTIAKMRKEVSAIEDNINLFLGGGLQMVHHHRRKMNYKGVENIKQWATTIACKGLLDGIVEVIEQCSTWSHWLQVAVGEAIGYIEAFDNKLVQSGIAGSISETYTGNKGTAIKFDEVQNVLDSLGPIPLTRMPEIRTDPQIT